jgi:2-iminobutanoate/2-iminopropanoate deaminase
LFQVDITEIVVHEAHPSQQGAVAARHQADRCAAPVVIDAVVDGVRGGQQERFGNNRKERRLVVRHKGFASLIISFSIFGPVSYADAQDANKKVISAPDAPKAIGPYSQAIRAGKTLYLSGQIAIDPATNQFMANASIEDQTRRALDNIAAVLAAEGLTMDHVVAVTVYLKDVNDFGKMNEVYGSYFKSAPPARATLEVARLPRDAKIEISAVAVAP